eukprot:5191954-Prymnesium_polylepis.1
MPALHDELMRANQQRSGSARRAWSDSDGRRVDAATGASVTVHEVEEANSQQTMVGIGKKLVLQRRRKSDGQTPWRL